jgi:hypothetical protein
MRMKSGACGMKNIFVFRQYFLHLIVFALLSFGPTSASAQGGPDAEFTKRLERVESKQKSSEAETHSKIQQIETKLSKLEKEYRDTGIGLFVSGIFCALWAQYTRRSSWLWFFFGLILAPLALIMLAWKNADDLSSGRVRFWARD